MTAASGPLAGIRIVEMDAIGPVPLAAMMLADMGAEIIRVGRDWGASGWNADSIGGSVLHRSRTLVPADLKNPAERDAVLDLIAHADAVIEGFRPGVMEKLGLGPDICLARNPKLVFGRMTGWGQTGPMALRAGHDINYISLTGALHAMGREGEAPPVPLNLVGDYGGGAMFLIYGVLAALLSAKTTGKGQVVDAAMVDGVNTLLAMFWALKGANLWSDTRADNLLDGGAPFYRCYTCSDGGHVAVGPLEPQFFAQMLHGTGLTDQNYRQNDRDDWPRMEADFTRVFASKTRDEWAAIFDGTDACVTPVLSMTEATSQPHLAARRLFDVRNGVTHPTPAPQLSGTPGAISDARTWSIDEALNAWGVAG